MKKVQAFGRPSLTATLLRRAAMQCDDAIGDGRAGPDVLDRAARDANCDHELRSPPMKKLVLETTAPFQGLPELVADREGLFAKEGLQIEWVERESEDKSTARQRQHPEGAQPVLQPRQDARAGQGRHVQRLRMGQLLPRPGHPGRQPPGRAARHRHLRRHRGAAGLTGVHRRSNSPARRSACRSTSARIISRCICSKASCRARTSSSAAPRTARGRASTR